MEKKMKHKVLFWSVMGISIIGGSVLTGIGVSMGGLDDLKEEYITVDPDQYLSSDYADIENLKFDLAACDVTLKEGDEYSISGTGVMSEITDHGETWHVYSPKRKWYRWFRNWRNWDKGEVTITLPSEKQFEDVDISFAAAEIDLEKLSAKNVELSGGAGSATIDTLLVTEDLDLSVGAGQINVMSGELSGDQSISCGAGEMTLKLQKLQGDTDVSCGMGEINLTLPGAKRDYSFEHSVVMGSIQIADKEEGSLRAEGESALAEIDLSCGMGTINVDFQ